jgi:hypothetical protein
MKYQFMGENRDVYKVKIMSEVLRGNRAADRKAIRRCWDIFERHTETADASMEVRGSRQSSMSRVSDTGRTG